MPNIITLLIKKLNIFSVFFLIALSINNIQANEIVNDVTQINPIIVDKIIAPESISEIQKEVKNHQGPISIGGGRFSMGGQTATQQALQIDMRKFNKIVKLDVKNKKITVESGITWRDIQEEIDKHNLSIKIMQTYSNFTVGGSLSVNAHGRYVGQGPLIKSVDSIKIILADGSLVEASPKKNSEIFYGAIGGYGAIGIIVEATLQLVDNSKIKRVNKIIPTAEYKKYFSDEVRNNKDAVFHNGDIYPPNFKKVNAVTWYNTDEELTDQNRLIPRNQKYDKERFFISLISKIWFGKEIRSEIIDPYYIYSKKLVTWRNHEASYDVAELEPKDRKNSTYVLQEYFIPIEKFEEFAEKMHKVFKKHDVNVMNVSIRHALPDPGSTMAWARQEVFSFVVYYKQETSKEAKSETANWTREMIGEAISVGGTYYLPYQIHATLDQFHQAYPNYQKFFDLKKKLDPQYKFRNKLWDKYYNPPLPDKIAAKIDTIKNYRRNEEQTFLTLPEWYIVFNSDEYASHLHQNLPSTFPYFKSIKEFWSLQSQAKKLSKEYPKNSGYNVMIGVIGGSYSLELALKGLYENSIGKITEFTSSKTRIKEDDLMADIYQDYASYVHIYPWYEYSFLSKLKSFWKDSDLVGKNMIRKWERKIFFSTEMLFKSAYSAIIKLGTKLSYEPEETKIYAVLKDKNNAIKNFDKIETQLEEGDFKIVSMPRYDQFRDLTIEMSKSDIEFVEISGNNKILLTAIGNKQNIDSIKNAKIVATSNITTNKELKRLLVVSQVPLLSETINDLKNNNFEIEHVFDY